MFFFRLLSRLPLTLLYSLSDFLFFLTCYVFKYRNKVIVENLQKSFPKKSKAEIEQLAKGFYKNLADVVVETIKLLSIDASTISKRTTIINGELLVDYNRRGQTVIVMASHQCNWEWLLQSCKVVLGIEVDAVYKPLHNKFFDKLMLQIRSRFGAYPVPSQSVFREIVKRKHISRTIAMVADQTPPPESIYKTYFLNQPTAFYRGAEKLAKATQYPVLFASMARKGRGHYQITIHPIAAPPFADDFTILDRYVQATECAIQQAPADWLWSHKRWKHTIELEIANIVNQK